MRLRLFAVALFLSVASAVFALERPPAAPAVPASTADIEDLAILGTRLVTLTSARELRLTDLGSGRTLAAMTLPASPDSDAGFRLTRVRGTDRLLVSVSKDMYRCDVSARGLTLTRLPIDGFLIGPEAAVGDRAMLLLRRRYEDPPVITVFDPDSGAVRRVCHATPDAWWGSFARVPANCVPLDDDGHTVAMTTINEIFLFDIETERVTLRLNTTDAPGQLALRGDTLVRCSGPRTVCLEARTGRVRWESRVRGDDVFCRAPRISPDGRLVAYLVEHAEGPARVEVRDLATGAEVYGFDVGGRRWTALWSPDGTQLVVAGDSGRVYCWDTAKWTQAQW